MKKIIAVLLIMMPFLVVAQSTADIQKMLRYRKYNSAENMARTLTTNDPANAMNWYWLSQVLLQKKDSTALSQLSGKLPSTIRNDAWMNVLNGSLALNEGKLQNARTQFEEAVDKTRGKDVGILEAVARLNIYSTNGNKEYALDQLKKAIRRDRKNPELYTLQGDAYFRLKNGSEAYKAFEHAIKINSSYAPALYELGKIFATQNNESVYLKYFTDAINADAAFAPALYDLYYHYYKKDINKAFDYFTKYLAVADVQPADEYQLVDILYLTKQYDKAISKANALLSTSDPENRLNKMLAYTYKDINKPDSALFYMNRYFNNGVDTNYLLQDYELMVNIYGSLDDKADSVVAYYERIVPLLKDQSDKYDYYKKIAAHYKSKKDYGNQSVWLSKYYDGNDKATNVDLFNLGLSHYQAQQYHNADSVFGYYSTKYPDHVYGYYWQARSNAAIDSTMEIGLAIPHYTKMIEIAEKDTADATNKRYLIEAYGYIAAYTANEEKNYTAAIDYFEKLLELDPANDDAKKYIEILEKTTESSLK